MSGVADVEARLAALEHVVALLVASHHLQHPDPDVMLGRLERVLLEDRALAELERAAISRLAMMVREIQQELPPRLTDA